MKNCSIMRLLILIPLLAQGAPDDSSPAPSSTNRVPGVLPWIIGAAVTGGCYWAYSHFNPNTKGSFLEEKTHQTLKDLKYCLKENKENAINQLEVPTQCNEELLAFALAREAINNPSQLPHAQEVIDRFNATKF